MYYLQVLTITSLLLQLALCQSGVLNWLLGRNSKHSGLIEDFEDDDVPLPANLKPSIVNVQSDEVDFYKSPTSIPFELSVADEKFIADAQKYTDLNLSQLDVCQHKVI